MIGSILSAADVSRLSCVQDAILRSAREENQALEHRPSNALHTSIVRALWSSPSGEMNEEERWMGNPGAWCASGLPLSRRFCRRRVCRSCPLPVMAVSVLCP